MRVVASHQHLRQLWSWGHGLRTSGGWPLYAYRDGVWYENMERYSVTTSKHRRQARPAGVETVLKNVTSMKAIYGNHGWGWSSVQSL